MDRVYDFIRIKKSKNPKKKYDGLLERKIDGKIKRVPFGDKRYEQYKDATGLGLYSKLNHLDNKRRDNFLKRHDCKNAKKYTPNWFSCKFLW